MSHEVSPLMKLVGRGDTTVVDAYLSPILRAYVDRVAAETGDVRLMFMQSNGGLVDARLFQGKDAILSGPAGGIVGAAKTAALAGLDRIVGFDMGGTSTDVTHYAGAFERAFDTEVAGVRIRAPMMKIHTVAAGGGSIISFDGQRFRVGPESAGANPGPACYRRGGPLAVTDANLMVGKLLPDFFPHVFGPSADQPLDAEVVRAAFAALAHEVAKSTGIERTPEELAHGCLAIANDNMANAIKEISVQRGIDVTQGYALVLLRRRRLAACLPGGGPAGHRPGLHPPLRLGPVGLWHGPRRRAGAAPAGDRAAARRRRSPPSSRRRCAALGTEAVRGAARPGRARRRASPSRRGCMSAMPAPTPRWRCRWPTPRRLRAAFEAEHRSRYGFIVEGRGLVVEAVTVEGIGTMEEVVEPELPAAGARRTPLEPVLTHARLHHPRAAPAGRARSRPPSTPARRCCRATGSPARPWSAAPPPPSWSSPAGRSR